MMQFADSILEEYDVCSREGQGMPNFRRFQVVEESMYSSLRPFHAQQVIRAVKRHVENPKNIIDATAHIGCDSVNFALQLGASVVSIENDEKVFDVLNYNLCEFHGDAAGRTQCAVRGNILTFIQGFKLPMDFVYIDPPWGGVDYWKEKKKMLHLTDDDGKDIPIYDVVNMVFAQGFTELVVLKVPSNFDTRTFTAKGKLKIVIEPILKPHKRFKAFDLLFCRPVKN